MCIPCFAEDCARFTRESHELSSFHALKAGDFSGIKFNVVIFCDKVEHLPANHPVSTGCFGECADQFGLDEWIGMCFRICKNFERKCEEGVTSKDGCRFVILFVDCWVTTA